MTGKLNSSLSAELHHNPVRLLGFNNRFDVLLCKRIKIKPVAGIKIRGNSFRIVIADYSLIPFLFKRPYAVNGAVVKFYTLTYSYRSGAEYYYFLLSLISSFNKLLCFVFFVIR